ncbi:GNAT family N-acetyltransferase [Acidobacteriota bacterium]
MRIEKISTLEKLVEVRDEWNILVESSSQNCIFLTNEWFCAWFESFGDPYQLSVLLFRDQENRLFGAAPLMETSSGLKFMANHEVTDYCDFIVESGKEELFYTHYLQYWQEDMKKPHHLLLINIREDSPTLLILSRMAEERQFENSILEAEVAPSLDLPLTYDEYLKNLKRKNRHELLRKTKKVDSLKSIVHKRVYDPEGARNCVGHFLDLHRKSSSFKREFWEKKGVEPFFYKITDLFSKNGWIEFNVLCLQDGLAAMLLNFIYHDEIHFYNIAFNANYAPYSPGIYLFNQSIRRAIKDNLKRADFLRGKEKYKFYLGAKECKIMDFTLSKKEMNS